MPSPLPLKVNTFSGFRKRSCLQPSFFKAMGFSELSGFSELWVFVQTSNLLFSSSFFSRTSNLLGIKFGFEFLTYLIVKLYLNCP
ncbi:hypothetical protein ACE6H2_026563 [Prunus campanulata]